MMLSTRKGPLCNLRTTHAQIMAFIVRLQWQYMLQYILTNRECSDQTARMRLLIWTNIVCKLYKGLFSCVAHQLLFNFSTKKSMIRIIIRSASTCFCWEIRKIQSSLVISYCWEIRKIQSSLVISTSIISNNRLSRSENLVPDFNVEI